MRQSSIATELPQSFHGAFEARSRRFVSTFVVPMFPKGT
jgi:hypothetical protein